MLKPITAPPLHRIIMYFHDELFTGWGNGKVGGGRGYLVEVGTRGGGGRGVIYCLLLCSAHTFD